MLPGSVEPRLSSRGLFCLQGFVSMFFFTNKIEDEASI